MLSGGAAVPGLISPPPVHTGTALAAPEKVLEETSQENKSVQGTVLYLNAQRSWLFIYTKSLGHTRPVDTDVEMV